MTLVEQYREEVLRRYVPGVFGGSMIAKELGIGRGVVYRILNPDYEERQRIDSRERKRSLRGTCEVCGGETRYNGQKGQSVSPVCSDCAPSYYRRWTREAVIEAIQEWARVHGRAPTTTDWHGAGEGHPAAGTVYGPHAHFDRWSDAIEAAGLEHPHPNRVRKGGPGHQLFDRDEARALRSAGLLDYEIAERLGVTPSAIGQAIGHKGQRRLWTEETIIEKIRELSVDGLAPSGDDHRALCKAARRYIGSWREACLRAGVRPRR